jgi:hypothetical protein
MSDNLDLRVRHQLRAGPQGQDGGQDGLPIPGRAAVGEADGDTLGGLAELDRIRIGGTHDLDPGVHFQHEGHATNHLVSVHGEDISRLEDIHAAVDRGVVLGRVLVPVHADGLRGLCRSAGCQGHEGHRHDESIQQPH